MSPDQPQTIADRALRSSCPVAGALDLVGDKWTLLVVRDLLRGKRRYGDFASSSEHIPTNILAERLRRLEQAGIIERVRYSERPPRYEYRLTPCGQDLQPAIRALAAWGVRYVDGTRMPPDVAEPST
ncbi:MAG: helix-turn-helix domain-containing protein [Chloroflexota bacterium]